VNKDENPVSCRVFHSPTSPVAPHASLSPIRPAKRGARDGCRGADGGGIIDAMPTRRRADPMPDLFASLPTAKAPERPAAPRAVVVESRDPATRPTHLLPKDLPGALTRLADAEVDSLLAAVIAEAKRRGRLVPTSLSGAPAEARSRSQRAASNDGAGSLTTGKLNAVRPPSRPVSSRPLSRGSSGSRRPM
jgi:hypothetical protein